MPDPTLPLLAVLFLVTLAARSTYRNAKAMDLRYWARDAERRAFQSRPSPRVQRFVDFGTGTILTTTSTRAFWR